MKYIKILTILLKLNFENVIVYRTNAVLIFFGASLYNLGAVMFLSYLFTKIPLIGGWDRWDMILLYGVGEVVYIFYLFFTRINILHFDRLVTSGDFDFYLTKPINSMFYATIHFFSYENFFGLLQAAAIVLYAISGGEFSFTPSGFLLAIISGFISFLLIHFLSILTIIPSLGSIQSKFYRLMSEASMLTKYPFEIFTNTLVKIFFFSVVPYALIVNVPFRLLITNEAYLLFALQIVVVIIFAIVVKILWNKALKHYSSASS